MYHLIDKEPCIQEATHLHVRNEYWASIAYKIRSVIVNGTIDISWRRVYKVNSTDRGRFARGDPRGRPRESH